MSLCCSTNFSPKGDLSTAKRGSSIVATRIDIAVMYVAIHASSISDLYGGDER